ncbi:MAG: HAD family hydrolase [Deltaproteobacteria bacterium]|nr:HAD family hydrolase [Deltaproteobacteria bacterium]
MRAITFDLWDTVFIDDSDEPKRKQQGLPPKPIARRMLVHDFLNKKNTISKEIVDAAYDTVDAAFVRVWHEHSITWSVAERLEVLLKGLKHSLADAEMSELVRQHEEMELSIRPDLAPGIKAALDDLKGKYKLGVISDAIFSPGRVLRKLLEAEDLLDYFESFTFSDELGCSKPAARVFEAAAAELGVEPGQLVHIGDRESNDVAGPQAIGAKAVLTTVVIDRGQSKSKADAICNDYAELTRVIQSL